MDLDGLYAMLDILVSIRAQMIAKIKLRKFLIWRPPTRELSMPLARVSIVLWSKWQIRASYTSIAGWKSWWSCVRPRVSKGRCGRGSSVGKASWIQVSQKGWNWIDVSSIPGCGIWVRKILSKAVYEANIEESARSEKYMKERKKVSKGH